ncbi:HepT-like ribonuclease domain-containing protein [Niveispirillum cyanobacteriorum]|uniref:DUF86 domain-containing protein n=1 Tax=Niveispirillum cyanobacteriorum TaxID=1612173 RepID=A0A2K9NDE5_9PROT|nr:HepT-like ribonuclease domain-containing protein [Niveispirillum cyanobacteriorum]AUN31124.1 DUF86 domain-containing protein [Niveispirillum cyanobacteriorum]GGE84742.1 DUF86 domain-containing protein [Niveispirillum cyanobacteriorum]
MGRGDDHRVADILAAIADIRSDTEAMDYPAFAANPVVIRSVLYSIGVIGEAAKSLSPAVKDSAPDIPWRAIGAIRDRIVHEYFRTNTRRIWDVVMDDLDGLESTLQRWQGR